MHVAAFYLNALGLFLHKVTQYPFLHETQPCIFRA